MASVAPLIVITGPTASGKSALALELAKKWGGEIICADSRTVYKGMNIGTAKPTLAEQKSVPHWLLDLVEPGERFTVADFQHLAFEAVNDIRSRGKIPFLVGGTGLYVDAVVLNFVFGPEADFEQRSKLEKLTVEQLITLHHKQRIALPENEKNKRYLIRNIEKYNNSTSRKEHPDATTHQIAISVKNDVLKERIQARIEHMFANGIVYETQQLIKLYGVNNEAMTGNIYRIVKQMADNVISKDEAIGRCAVSDWRLAKRQRTWLKRHDYVRWLTLDDARTAIESILEKYRDA